MKNETGKRKNARVFSQRVFLDGTYFKSVKMTTGTFNKISIKIRDLSLNDSFFIFHFSFFINIGPSWRIDLNDGPINKNFFYFSFFILIRTYALSKLTN
jgi:hypothetical protein